MLDLNQDITWITPQTEIRNAAVKETDITTQTSVQDVTWKLVWNATSVAVRNTTQEPTHIAAWCITLIPNW
jgi:hypothetical protein